MDNILHVLKRDTMRLLKAPAALIVIAAILVMPSLYTWYNVLGFWNPYDSTGNIRVCVVNQDQGAENDLTGELNVGESIVEALQENDKLSWVIEDYDTAMDDLKSGDVYAVYVIPSDFSECLISPLTGDVKSPKLEYYVNEKLGPISPKITDAGATALDQTINSMFVKAVSDAVAGSVDEAIDDAKEDIDTTESQANTKVDEAMASLQQVRDSLAEIEQATQNAQDKAGTARAALDDAAVMMNDSAVVLQDVSVEAANVQTELAGISSSSISSLADVLAQVAAVASNVSIVAGNITSAAGTAQTEINRAAGEAQQVVNAMNDAASILRSWAATLPDDDPAKAKLDGTAADIESRASELQVNVDEVVALSWDVYNTSVAAQDTASALATDAQQASNNARTFSDILFGSTAPTINATLGQVSVIMANLSIAVSNQQLVIVQAQMCLDQLNGVLEDSKLAISQTDELVAGLQGDLDQVTTDVRALGQSSIIANLLDNGTLNASSISDFMGSPTELETVTFYSPNSYGAAMAPLFMNLTFWIGAFMLMIVMRKEADSEGIGNLTLSQRYLGRFALFALIVIGQAIICCIGTMLLGVHVANVAALFLASALASLTYLSIIYALSLSFQHIGMGICFVLVFAQIPGATGLYPPELTSHFFQTIYPFLPFTYGIDAMRESICGFYGSYFIHDLSIMSVFFFAFLALGLMLHPLMANVNRMVAKQVRESDLFNGGEVVTPARPYRLSQVARILSEREDYHQNLADRYERFSRVYPQLIRGSIAVGIAVPVAVVFLFALTTTEKETLLTMCFLGLLGLSIFLVVVESLRYSFERQMNLASMSHEHVLKLISVHEHLVKANMHITSFDARLKRHPLDSIAMKSEAPEPETTEPEAPEPESEDYELEAPEPELEAPESDAPDSTGDGPRDSAIEGEVHDA